MSIEQDLVPNAEAKRLETVVRDLAYRLGRARPGSAEYRMIERQVAGIKHASELGCLIVEELEMEALL